MSPPDRIAGVGQVDRASDSVRGNRSRGLPGPPLQSWRRLRCDESGSRACENVYAEWCPNSNLFATYDLAESWAKQHEIEGRVLGLDAASMLATGDWEKLAEGVVL